MSTGPYERKNGKWCPTIMTPDGTILELGEFATRAEATAAFKKARIELYPPELPRVIDPARHDSLNAADLTAKPFKTYH